MPSYETAFDFSRDRSFQPVGVQVTGVGTSGSIGYTYDSIVGRLLDPVSNPFLRYESANQQSSITLFNSAPQLYQASQITLRESDRLIYVTDFGSLAISQPGPKSGGFSTPLQYTINVVQSGSVRNSSGKIDSLERRFVAGASTIASDVPKSGGATYRVMLSSYFLDSTGSNSINAQNAEIAIDYTAKTIRGTITATSTSISMPISTVVINLTGQIDSSSNRLSGTVTSADGGTGQFSGELYGPQGIEAGIAFALSRSSNQIAGTIVGIRR